MYDPSPRPVSGYDWTRHGRHRLRAPDAVIVEVPLPVAADSQMWVATIWPDQRLAGGWNRALWEPTGRGWRLPHQLAAGDVIEFGADTPRAPVRWFGILDSYEPDRWATFQGPYPTPHDAWTDAQRLLALERFQPALRNEPDQPSRHRNRTGRHGRHHRRPK